MGTAMDAIESVSTVQDAFARGLDLVRADGIPASGKDIAVIAAFWAFESACAGKVNDPRFPTDGPRYARFLILNAYANGR